MAELNRLARADRVACGQVADGLALADGVVGVGDVVVARHNDRASACLTASGCATGTALWSPPIKMGP